MNLDTQKLYDAGKASLEKDLVNDPTVPNEVQCAAQVNAVHRLAFGNDVGGGASTKLMYESLLKDPRFKQVDEYSAGRIIISPTGYSSKGAPHGHVGICGYYGVMSNNSLNGLWQQVYDEASWKRYYHDKLGFPVYFFERL